jgi:hypothetical protein
MLNARFAPLPYDSGKLPERYAKNADVVKLALTYASIYINHPDLDLRTVVLRALAAHRFLKEL